MEKTNSIYEQKFNMNYFKIKAEEEKPPPPPPEPREAPPPEPREAPLAEPREAPPAVKPLIKDFPDKDRIPPPPPPPNKED